MSRAAQILLAILLPARLLAADYAEGLAPPGAPANAFPAPSRPVARIVTSFPATSNISLSGSEAKV